MELRSCQNCTCLCNEDFKQVVNLKSSGLMIYIPSNKLKQKRYYSDLSINNIILCNTRNKDIKRFDYVVELCQYRTKCLRCQMLIQRVRNIIDEISIINKNDVIGVCDLCKRSHQKNKCRRCQYIVEKFLNNKAIENENRDVRFKLWLSKLQQILKSFLEAKVICKHNICLDYEYKSQLQRLLNSLNSPVPMRHPEISPFPELLHLKETGVDIGENGNFLNDLVRQFKNKEIGENNDIEPSFSSSRSESDCICKHFVSNKSDHKPLSSLSISKGDENDTKLITSFEHLKQGKPKSETLTVKPSTDQKSKLMQISKNAQNRYSRSNKENKLSNKSIKSSNNVKKSTGLNSADIKSTQKGKKGKIGKQTPEQRLMLEMLKDREEDNEMYGQLGESKKKQKPPKKIKDLPDLKPIKRPEKAENLEIQASESILECKDNRLDVVTEMIKGTKIVRMDSKYRDIEEEHERLPLLFRIKTDVTETTSSRQPPPLPIHDREDSKNKKPKKDVRINRSGIIRYRLSNREFIEKGWTKLPSIKIMRRMNIYKMLPASDKFDWFQNYKKPEYLFYHTGEKFAEINDSGGGKWFYKNGNVTLDGHSDEDSNTVKRYVIYSSGEDTVSRKKEPTTILACFDLNGNGVVYDCCGNVRLKYNQSEGLLMDKNIGAPCRWKWHSLNDPPVLQEVFLNTYDTSESNDCFTHFEVRDNKIHANEDMIAIEFDNFVKEKTYKLMQKFKPFQIRIKVLKINDHFSLRIVDQANIFLLFRCDGMYFKISIGMLLKSDEIIDTDTAEMSDVSTPYDKCPPKTPSLINIYNTISNVRKHYGSSKKSK